MTEVLDRCDDELDEREPDFVVLEDETQPENFPSLKLVEVEADQPEPNTPATLPEKVGGEAVKLSFRERMMEEQKPELAPYYSRVFRYNTETGEEIKEE